MKFSYFFKFFIESKTDIIVNSPEYVHDDWADSQPMYNGQNQMSQMGQQNQMNQGHQNQMGQQMMKNGQMNMQMQQPQMMNQGPMTPSNQGPPPKNAKKNVSESYYKNTNTNFFIASR